MAWNKICQTKEEGDFGVRNVRLQALALGAKLIWRMIQNP